MTAIKKINRKSFLAPFENVASPNAAIAVGGGYLIYILYTAIIAAGLLLIAGTIEKLGCRCSCQCYTDWNNMAAVQGYFNNAVTMARR